jgi:hypothetical protein
LKIHLAVDIEWVEYQAALAMNTHRRWVVHHDYDYEDNCNDNDEDDAHHHQQPKSSYMPEDDGGIDAGGGDGGGNGSDSDSGKWVYQRTNTGINPNNPSNRVEPISRFLENAEDFHSMREGEGNKGEWGWCDAGLGCSGDAGFAGCAED